MNHDVPKKVNDERFVDKTGKASWKTKHKPKAGNDSPMYASDPVFKKYKLMYNVKYKILNT